MLECFAPADAAPSKPVYAVAKSGFEAWLANQSDRVRAWLEGSDFEAKPGRSTLIPGADGAPEAALVILGEPMAPWDVAALQARLPAGSWRLEPAGDGAFDQGAAALGFALASYRFDRYRKSEAGGARLTLIDCPDVRRAAIVAEAIFLARDLINTPALDLGPAELAQAVQGVAARFDADCRTLVGEDLLREGYPAIHAVGQASPRAPRMLDLRWGEESAPRVTLVGKGVCFDTGGLDIKPSQGMALMKKDMGGAAITLALAQAIMALRLPVRLRLLIGAVENSVSGSSYRPGDVLRTRKGLAVEVGNTDAEGRLVLCDLLADADGERPDAMIDCATLTGAARVALGPDLPALFTPADDFADMLLAAGQDAFDPLWRLPLFAPYREMIDSPIADINNAGSGGHAGAITAALFLKDFVSETRCWAHLDLFAWNPKDRPGRPKGGEATALRALLLAIERKFGA
jgi:leucyl aminopeptidase